MITPLDQDAAYTKTEPIKLWINNDWYIPVNPEGYCCGEGAEGALGFIIKLSRSEQANFSSALKIPRLMGDTHRENAYVCELMEQELKTVQFVENYHTSVPKRNILGVASSTSLLRGQIRTIPGDPSGADWNHAIVLVNFKKGRRPRFCLVKKEGEALKFWPETLSPITLDNYEEIKRRSHGWSQTVFIENKSEENEITLFPIAEAITRSSVGETWYANLPSVNYTWAPGTLQESISLVREQPDGSVQSERGPWKIQDHTELAKQICYALYTLHARNMLHADLRPANIVFQAGPSSPTSYMVSDYGSFAQTAPRALESFRDGVGQTMGPVMVGERASAFYAPERRLGREREASDTAVLIPEGHKCLRIVLGWRSDLIDENGTPREERIRAYMQDAKLPEIELVDKILRAGDRVQLRENIFELIEDEQRIGDKQVLICEYNYWQIYHGRVAVRNPVSEEPREIIWFPIPRTIELMKWSVATDLYSLGALLLYSIFRNKVKVNDNGSEIEDQFREMLSYLDSELYFNAVWPELDWLRSCMEYELNTHTQSALNFSIVKFSRYNRQVADRPEDKEPRYDRRLIDPLEDKEPKNLLAAAEELTNRLTQTAPGIRRVVEGLDYNLAAFVFIMHFALCCLHRESHFTEKPADKRNKDQSPEWKQELPFCKHRRESPEKSSATKMALDRIIHLQELLDRGELKEMIPKEIDKIGTFDPRPDVSIRIERDQYKRQIDELKPKANQIEKMQEDHEKLERYAADVSAEKVRLIEANKSYQAVAEQKNQQLQSAHHALDELQQLIDTNGWISDFVGGNKNRQARTLLNQLRSLLQETNTSHGSSSSQ